eukprot:scaffold119011_cov63-Phaeocystis_antarctica.AAC.4
MHATSTILQQVPRPLAPLVEVAKRDGRDGDVERGRDHRVRERPHLRRHELEGDRVVRDEHGYLKLGQGDELVGRPPTEHAGRCTLLEHAQVLHGRESGPERTGAVQSAAPRRHRVRCEGALGGKSGEEWHADEVGAVDDRGDDDGVDERLERHLPPARAWECRLQLSQTNGIPCAGHR